MTTSPEHSPETLWAGANLATMGAPEVACDPAYGTIRDGAVLTRGAKIVWVGPADAVPPPGAESAALSRRVAQCKGLWLTPGLIDCHTHLVYGGDRSNEFEMRLNGADYRDIARAGGGILSTVRATRAASEDQLYQAARVRLDRMREDGITTVEIKSGYGLDVATELKMLKVARRLGEGANVDVVTTFLGAHTVPPEFQRREDYVRYVIEKMLPAVAEAQAADAVDVFCETIAFSAEDTARIFEAAISHGLRVKLHAEQLSDSGGAGLGARFGALSADHLEYVSEDSARALAEAGTVAVLLPGAYYFLRETKRPPVELLRKHRVPIAIATDCNPGTSPLQSILLTMNMACVLFGLSPAEALVGTTRNAARALGIDDRKGVLAAGMTADFALWDISSPLALSYGMGAKPCVGVVKNGALAWCDSARWRMGG
jgi:imidazolonepropionase